MCRWLAYAGPEIYLEDLIFPQKHSIEIFKFLNHTN